MNYALCILKRISIINFALCFAFATAFAQNPAEEILDMLSDREVSPLDHVMSVKSVGNADETGVLEFLAGYAGNTEARSALDYVQSEASFTPGALDFISSTIVGHSVNVGGMGYGMRGYGALPFAGQRVTSNFGYRPKFGRMHKGIDIAMSVGDTVRVPLPGTVRKVSYEARGYGHYVTVVHDDGMETRYAHLSHTLVTPGERLDANQPIALSGNSGNSTGPHLHFETRYLGTAVNPAEVFTFTPDAFHFLKEIGANPYQGMGTPSNIDRDSNSRSNLDGSASVVSASRRTYVVRQGDTIKKIARKTGIPAYRLCQLNFITETAPLEPGRMLKLR